MTFYDFTFLGKRPTDFGSLLHVKTHDIGFPDKNKYVQSVANSNITFDFSAIYGSQTYGEREVKYVINVLNGRDYDAEAMHGLKTRVINWVLSANSKQPLYDDKLPDYHFLAEVQGGNAIADNFRSGELTITFTCYPFMIKNRAEGDDDWDSFDFENGIAQDVEFDVNGVKEIYLINDGITEAYPEITASAKMTITINGVSYQIVAGRNTGIVLPIGENPITISGKGHINFDWHKEVI